MGRNPVISSELENCLAGAFQQAREARHEYVTVEHLLNSQSVTRMDMMMYVTHGVTRPITVDPEHLDQPIP